MSDYPKRMSSDIAGIIPDPELFRSIAREVEAWIGEDSSGHDMDHAWRVFNVGVRLAEAEGANCTVIGAAALTHDIHRSMGDGGEYVHPEESLSAVRGILERTEFPDELISAVLHCVEVHDEYDFRDTKRPAETIEAEILRDADNLDAIGAVGIARTFAFAGAVGNPLWAPNEDEYSGLGHFDDKLFHLKDEMHTERARSLAKDRHAFLKTFAQRFEDEWYGNK